MSGGLVGGTIGCNYQRDRWVFGIEGDGSWSGQTGSSNLVNPPFNPNFREDVSQSYIATIRGRVGYTITPTVLIYGTAGGAFADLKAVDLIRHGDAIAGVRARTPDGIIDIEADLTIACDGRHSTVRERAGLAVKEIGAPIDVLWFRAGRRPDETENLFARIEPGKMMVTFDRGGYWQCAYVIAKGQYDAVRARGLQALLDDVVRLAPVLRHGIADVKSFDDVKLLTVAINRLSRWTRPGLLCIGDAAHAMSPIGGVGVNLAVQDAVAAANLLADGLTRGCPSEQELDAIRRRREFPVRMTQAMQVVVQNRIISTALKGGDRPLEVPLLLRLISALPWLQGIPARFLAIGVRPEHVHSRAAPSS